MKAAKKAKESWQKVASLKEKKPIATEKLQTKVSTEKNLVVQIEATKKPNGATKVEELAAMEEALKKATEEAHKQRVALMGKSNPAEAALAQAGSSSALMQLKKKQDEQKAALLHQLEEEENQR